MDTKNPRRAATGVSDLNVVAETGTHSSEGRSAPPPIDGIELDLMACSIQDLARRMLILSQAAYEHLDELNFDPGSIAAGARDSVFHLLAMLNEQARQIEPRLGDLVEYVEAGVGHEH